MGFYLNKVTFLHILNVSEQNHDENEQKR